MHLHDRFFGNPTYRERLTGAAFEKTCAAHFLAFRRVEPRYATEFRRFVIEAMQSVVPPDRLAAARLDIGHDSGLVAWKGRVRDELQRRAATLLAKAGADFDREVASALNRVEKLALPSAEDADRTRLNEPQLAIACATYFGNNPDGMLAITDAGERG
jgi:hypothetical protein